MDTSQAPKRYATDPHKPHATFNVAYPQSPETFLILATREDIATKLPQPETKGGRGSVTERRLSIRAKGKNIESMAFSGCNFHDQGGKALANIEHITFKNCVFVHSWLGTIHYLGVRFFSCTFQSCDFGFSNFEHCVFEDCEFKDCSGATVYFNQTELEPAAFLKGLSFLERNYSADSEAQRLHAKRELAESRRRVAAALLVSNGATNSRYVDASLLELRRMEEELYWNSWEFGATGLAD